MLYSHRGEVRAEVSKAFTGQDEQGHRPGALPSQTCNVKQSSARLRAGSSGHASRWPEERAFLSRQ